MNKKKLTPVDIMNIYFNSQVTKEPEEKIGPSIHKKILRETRKEAKKLGLKITGKYGPDGKYHVYVEKEGFRRQVA